MSNLLTTERKYILKTVAISMVLNCITAFFLYRTTSENTALALAVVIMLIIVYSVIPRIVRKKRKLVIEGNKYFNVEGEDISSKIPSSKNFIIVDGLYYVCMAIAFKLISLKIDYYGIDSHTSETINYYQIMWYSIFFSSPLLMKNLYFFVKDLPTASYSYLVSKS
jgi:hypothetical protein